MKIFFLVLFIILPQSAFAEIKIKDWKYSDDSIGNLIIDGTVLNDGKETVQIKQVLISAYDGDSKKFIGNGSTYLDIPTIHAQKKTPFTIFIRNVANAPKSLTIEAQFVPK